MTKSQHDIPVLDTQGLRRFGFMMVGVIAGLFGLFLPWLLGIDLPTWPWLIAVIFFVWSLAFPDSLGAVYQIWMRFGLLSNRITTPLILGLVFYMVLFPTAVIMKIVKRGALSSRWDKASETYRINSEKRSVESMEKPF